jgi:class 3 adenylate cyclase
VIAGECGDSKRQITYLGDVLNVAARLEQVGKAINAGFVVSADILKRIALPANVHAQDRGEYTLNGVANPLRVYSLTSDRELSSEGASSHIGAEARSAAE